jgi:dTMP kinase
MNQLAASSLTPDLTILLDIPVALIPSRKSDNTQDKFDMASSEFHNKVRQGYLSISRREPTQWLVLDATQSQRTLSEDIWGKIRPLL